MSKRFLVAVAVALLFATAAPAGEPPRTVTFAGLIELPGRKVRKPIIVMSPAAQKIPADGSVTIADASLGADGGVVLLIVVDEPEGSFRWIVVDVP